MEYLSASMVHSAATITLLSVTQYNTFAFGKKLFQAVCGIVLLMIGISFPATNTLAITCLFCGCWTLISLDMPAKYRANRIVKAMNGNFPINTYRFYSNHLILTSNQISEEIPYSSLIRLIENKKYLFLYISPFSAYMVDPKTISSSSDVLKKLLEDSTGLKWESPNRLLTFSRKSVFRHKNHKA